MGELQRVQVLIGADQRKKLARLARREGKSISGLMRELIERGLEQRAQEQTEWEAALERLARRRQAQKPYRGKSLLAQARTEREKQLERVWRQSS
ncbi:MAG: ribbon-helix-helix protein, CopG family [Chloroflexota bacterium]|nr:MAG: ribbon-helix-helix protein, CopG family [Chloroflexota bacterium]